MGRKNWQVGHTKKMTEPWGIKAKDPKLEL
jgi:hypothetical protein